MSELDLTHSLRMNTHILVMLCKMVIFLKQSELELIFV